MITGRGHSRLTLFLIAIVVAVGISVPIGSALGQGSSSRGSLFLLASLGALLGGAGFFVGSLIDRRKRTHLDLFNQGQRPNIDKISVASLAVGILGVIAIIVALLVAHFDAIHPP